MFQPGASPAPQLLDPKAKEIARRHAKKTGLWQRLNESLEPSAEIPVVRRSNYRIYKRTGNRMRFLKLQGERRQRLEMAALAAWMNHPKGDLDHIQDLLWAYCDDWTWVMAAHEGSVNDLGSTQIGSLLVEIVHALQDKIEDEVRDRVHGEVRKRVLDEFESYHNTEFWYTAPMNWNHVCNGGIIRAAQLIIKDPRKLAKAIHPVIQRMTYALDGFTDDGGCLEGPGYWGFGFGHFVRAAYSLHCQTGGQLNLMEQEKIKRIARFPLAVHIEGDYRINFADGGHGKIDLGTVLRLNHFFDLPELFALCPVTKTSNGKELLNPNSLEDISLYRGEKPNQKKDDSDTILRDLGIAKLRGQPGENRMTLSVLAGHNGVPHNHNDIGHFLVHKHGRMLLVDPGAPVYTSKTFSSKRYEILFCRSRGHSVPVINGKEQCAGYEYAGALDVVGANELGSTVSKVDMTRAYPKGTVKSLTRQLTLDTELNSLHIEDTFVFSRQPKALEEAFVTFEKASVIRSGKSVRIGSVKEGAILTAQQPGTFKVETLVEETEDSKPGSPPLVRISFTPASFKKTMVLCFSLV